MTDFIEVYPDVIPKEFCQELIKQFEQSPHKYQGVTGGGVDLTKKISQDIVLNNHSEFESVLQTIVDACTTSVHDYVQKYYFSLISSISLNMAHPVTKEPTQLTADNFDEVGKPNGMNILRYLFKLAPINIQKYDQGKGNYGYWHSEIFPQTGENNALHRVLLFIIYLNDVEEGGETDFYYQNKSVKPKAGSMVIAPCGFTHTHRGNIPRSNDKYILTSWVQYNRAEQIYTQTR